MNVVYSKNWEAYARAHGKTPSEMLESDKVNFPGGCMTGFILWIDEKKREFYKAHPEACLGPHVIYNYEAWEKFLWGDR